MGEKVEGTNEEWRSRSFTRRRWKLTGGNRLNTAGEGVNPATERGTGGVEIALTIN